VAAEYAEEYAGAFAGEALSGRVEEWKSGRVGEWESGGAAGANHSPTPPLPHSPTQSILRRYLLHAGPVTAAAIRSGMLDLKAYAGILLKEGTTTVEEVLNVVSVEE
jgi:hypothetical protein